ncbi:hypothetical protein PYW08_014406 [Mythimna loreyi]|uniref:Uncharacterized protein n=1 Tax=Mythimna loreyi TaxID=667449 RepID=A0ACC2R9J4_9NEOP|nr:hypothetical protein PYW08_014406 [Mythimna loreyi]
MNTVASCLPFLRRLSSEMDVNTFLIFYWYYRRRQRNRRLWVHPILTQRLNLGIFRNLMSDLRRDESKFFNYFRGGGCHHSTIPQKTVSSKKPHAGSRVNTAI